MDRTSYSHDNEGLKTCIILGIVSSLYYKFQSDSGTTNPVNLAVRRRPAFPPHITLCRPENAMITRASILFTCLNLLAAAHIAPAATRPPVSYGRDISPVLSDKCYRCHGPDAAARKAELRLDTRKGLSKKVVVAGQPQKSELVTRILSDDDDERMPPPDSKLSLSADQKDLLRRWVTEGAKFAEHWAFQPLPDKIPLPAVRDQSWPHQPFDRFVL